MIIWIYSTLVAVTLAKNFQDPATSSNKHKFFGGSTLTERELLDFVNLNPNNKSRASSAQSSRTIGAHVLQGRFEYRMHVLSVPTFTERFLSTTDQPVLKTRSTMSVRRTTMPAHSTHEMPVRRTPPKIEPVTRPFVLSFPGFFPRLPPSQTTIPVASGTVFPTNETHKSEHIPITMKESGLPVFTFRTPPTRSSISTNNSTVSPPNGTQKIGIGVSVFSRPTPVNESNQNESNTVQGLCGFPVYNDREICLKLNYYSHPLLECEIEHGAAAFGFFVILLALVIIFSNCLLPIVVWKRKEMRTQYDYIKVSLAFSDIVTGFVLLCAVIPNMAWSRRASESDVVNYVISNTNSPTAIVVGSFITMSAQASLLHLAFLSIERFIAIKYSFWHMMRRTRTVVMTLGVIWMVSFLCSFVPAAFPDHFEYKYQPALLIHLLTLKKLKSASGKYDDYGVHGEIYGAITMLLPYTIMVIFCVMTGVVGYRKLVARREKFGHTRTNDRSTETTTSNDVFSPNKKAQKDQIKPEMAMFVTIIIMIIAFTITLIPFTIVMFLFTGEILNCMNYTLPYVITFYIGMINCFVNAFIYTFRDRRFRKAVRSVFCSVFRKSESQTSTGSNFFQRSRQ